MDRPTTTPRHLGPLAAPLIRAMVVGLTLLSTGCGARPWLAPPRERSEAVQAAQAAVSGPQRCTAPADLQLADAGSAAAAGTVVTRILVHNVSNRACLIGTGVQVQILDAAGRALPATVVRDGTVPVPAVVVLAPRGSSGSGSDTAEIQVRWREACAAPGPVSASIVRVTVEDVAASVAVTPAPAGRAVPVCGDAVRVEPARAVEGGVAASP